MQAPIVIKSAKQEVVYPERDGKPMGETDVHRRWIMWLIIMLQQYYAGQQVYVTGDLLFYYEEGNPRRFVVPDVFVVLDHPPGDRRVYKLWEEGKAPNIIFEITSPSTKNVDQSDKLRLYAELGVQEYFLFDPLNESLRPPLKGYGLVAGRYQPIRTRQPNSYYSEVLDLTIRLSGQKLQLVQADGSLMLTPEERIEAEAQRAEQEAQRAEQEARLRSAAEAHALDLEAELRELRRRLGNP
jgi:Uma2 family endonuclease